jgi:hypothetical protein
MIESQAPKTRPTVRLESWCLWEVEVFLSSDLGSGRRDSNREIEILKPQRKTDISLKIERRYNEAIDGLLCISEACDLGPQVALWPWWGSRQKLV